MRFFQLHYLPDFVFILISEYIEKYEKERPCSFRSASNLPCSGIGKLCYNKLIEYPVYLHP